MAERFVKRYSVEHYSLKNLSDDELKKADAPFKSEENSYIVESAGFVPLSVKFKQFEQNGYIAKFNVDDFDSSDYKQLYTDDILISPDDDEFDIADKIALFKERKLALLNAKAKLAETNEADGSVADVGGVSQASPSVQAEEVQKTTSLE